MDQYRSVSGEVSRLITKRYSTSFSIASMLFGGSIRPHIYNIYGLVRIADEIVDTYSGKDALKLLDDFEKEVDQALGRNYSTNPIIQAFIDTASKFNVGNDLVAPFFKSMRKDTSKKTYSEEEYNEYIYGSAEVVGLMCLRVFCAGDDLQFQDLKASARRLGAAFQKINFLRDIQADYDERGRVYFPGVDFNQFDNAAKQRIEADIQADFSAALDGIRRLPDGARFGVYLAYKYYTQLFAKIKGAPAQCIARERFRVSDKRKVYLLFSSALRLRFNFL